MTIRKLTIAMAMVAASAQALAQNPPTEGDPLVQCFARAYSADHMAAHPGQRVAELQLMLTSAPYDGHSYYDATIRAMLIDRYGAYYVNAASCQEVEGGVLECGIECDGGLFDVRLDAEDGTAMLMNQQHGFILQGGCGDDGQMETVRIEADAEHAAFLLHQVPPEACPTDFWHLYPPEAR